MSRLPPIHGLLLALLLVLFAPVTVAYDFGSQPYNITLSPSSPLLNYTPNAITDGSAGWNQTYTASSWSVVGPPSADPTLQSAPIGNGSIIQWTNTSGSAISFNFFGTGFAVLGQVYQGRTELSIDGVTISTTASVSATTASQTQSPVASSTGVAGGSGTTGTGPVYDTRPVLGQAQGLDMAWHTITMTFYAAGDGGSDDGPTGIEVYGARLVMLNGQTGAATQNTTSLAVTRAADGELTLEQGWIWSGGWSLYDYPGNTSASQAYTSSANSVSAISIPSNTSIVLLIGSIVPPGASYGIITDIEAPLSVIAAVGNPAYAADSQTDQQASLNMLNYSIRTDWIAQNQVLYAMQWLTGYQGTVMLTTAGNGTRSGSGQGGFGGLGIDRAIFISADGNPSSPPNNTSPSSSPSSSAGAATSNKGAIAGGVVGGVAGLAILGGLIWFMLRRKRKQAPQPVEPVQSDEKFDIDPAASDDSQPLPAAGSTSAPYANANAISPYVALLPSASGAEAQRTPVAATSRDEKVALLQHQQHHATPSSSQTPTAIATSAPRTPAPADLPALRIPPNTDGIDTSTPLDSAVSAQPASASALLPRTRDEDAAFQHKWEVLNSTSTGAGQLDSTARTSTPTLASPLRSHLYPNVGGEAMNRSHSASPSGSEADRHRAVERERGYRFEEDAGRVPQEEESDAAEMREEVLPPNYDPAWRDQ